MKDINEAVTILRYFSNVSSVVMEQIAAFTHFA